MTAAAIERMSLVDRAWLEMDTPANPMIIAGVIELSGVAAPLSWGEELVQRLLRHRRFSERPDDRSDPPVWIHDDPEFGYHVRVLDLIRHDAATLEAAIAGELSLELDRGRPLWRVTLIPQPEQRLTVLFRAHHALADGIALMRVLMNCTDAAMRKPRTAQAGTPPHVGPLGSLIDRLEGANRILANLGDIALDDLHHPEHVKAQWRDARAAIAAVKRVLTLQQDNPAALRTTLSGHRRVAWSSDIKLGTIRALAHRLGATVNDVFMALLAGALGDVLRARGIGMPDSQNLRVSIPVNLRKGDGDDLGNCFGLVLLDLPIALQDPLRCLQIVSARMRVLKESPEAKAVLASLEIVGRLPVAWEKKVVGMVGAKAAAVVSNLPGPRRRAKVGGARIENLVFWPPQASGIGLGISLFSYAGRISVGVSADVNVLPEPRAVIDAFRAELAELRALARVSTRQPPLQEKSHAP